MHFFIFVLAFGVRALVNATELHPHQNLGQLGSFPNDNLQALAPEIRTAAALFARKAHRSKCSGRGRRVTVTNFHTVTASISASLPDSDTSSTTSNVLTDTSISTLVKETQTSLAKASTTSTVQETGLSVSGTASTVTSSVSTDKVSITTGDTETSLTKSRTTSDSQGAEVSASSIPETTRNSISTNATASIATEETETSLTEPSTISTSQETSTSAFSIPDTTRDDVLTNTTTSITNIETRPSLTETSTASTSPETTTSATGIPSINPTEPVPVSRAGGTLDPSAAAKAHAFDKTATRAVESVNIRAPDGRCLFVDPTAGDFRQNLIPVQLVDCSEAPNQKFDIVTKGKHNDGKAKKVLVVSVLMNGCLSFDGRREQGDTVTIFSCGGRAAGDGETDNAQLYPFDGSDSIALVPGSGNKEICLVAGDERLVSGPCAKDDSETFQIVEVL